jgi:hypothetical protein
MRALLLSVCALAASGCTSIAQSDAPALIVQPTAASRAELKRIVATALNRNDVTLADDALTRESVLLIERTPARDATGQRLSGRDLEKPEQFQLVSHDGRCTLIHQGSSKRYELQQTTCKVP